MHDRGKVLTQAMLMLAGGGEACADIEHLRSQGRLRVPPDLLFRRRHRRGPGRPPAAGQRRANSIADHVAVLDAVIAQLAGTSKYASTPPAAPTSYTRPDPQTWASR